MTPLDGTKKCGKNQPIRELAASLRELAQLVRERAGSICMPLRILRKPMEIHFLLA